MADKKSSKQNPDVNGTHESDAEKIVHRHLADQSHKITEEELAGIRVGVTAEPDAPTKQAARESDDRVADKEANSEGETTPGAQKSTPWDVIE